MLHLSNKMFPGIKTLANSLKNNVNLVLNHFFILSSVLFNIYLKLMGRIAWHFKTITNMLMTFHYILFLFFSFLLTANPLE